MFAEDTSPYVHEEELDTQDPDVEPELEGHQYDTAPKLETQLEQGVDEHCPLLVAPGEVVYPDGQFEHTEDPEDVE